MGRRVLAVGPAGGRGWTDELDADGWVVDAVGSTRGALSVLATSDVDCVVVEHCDAVDGLDVVTGVREFGYREPVLLVSERPDGKLAAAATRLGVTEYYPREAADESLPDRVQAQISGGGPAPAETAPSDTASARHGEPDESSSTAGARDTVRALDAVDDGLYVLDRQGHFVVVNDSLAEMTGYEVDDLVGEHVSAITTEAASDDVFPEIRRVIRGETESTTVTTTIAPADGDTFPAEDRVTAVTEDGEVVGVAGVIRDITDRKERERELREARERFAELLDTSRGLLGAHSRERIAEIVVAAVEDALGYDLNVVRLYDPETETLRPVAGSDEGTFTASGRPVYAPGEGGPGIAFETGAARHNPTDIDVADEDLPPDIAETLYVPLGDQGTISIGATESGAFDEQDRSLAAILASNAAVALDRVDYEDELVQYRTVLENVQDMVYVADETGRFSLVTEPLATWLGRERAALVGAPVASVLGDESALSAAVEGVRDGGVTSRTVETTFEREDGDPLPGEVEVSLLPADEGFAGTVGVVRDRSELLETRERLESQRDRFTYLFDNLPDAVVEASHEDGRPIVRSVNDAFTDVFGYEAAAIAGESIDEFVLPADERENGGELNRLAAAGDVVQREVRRETADGYRDFLFRGIPYDTENDGTRSFGIYTDISEQKERERRLQVLNRVLRHNLRNDLNVVLGYAEMIADRVEDERVDEWTETLVETASEVASLSDRARSLDRTMREGSLRDRTVGLAGVIDSVVAEYRREHADAQIETDVDDLTVVGDGRIELALSEPLENSVEYGGDRIRVETHREAGRVDVRVADDGPGIPETEREAVDESSEITQLEHGSGLGLWIVRWVCDSCGGRLRFEESDLGGTAVVLSLTPADE
ncbi:PAS domain S-box protein [Halosimplex salinum]|uniref:PAS domain S-box protein n=1 Tax=Halosimplex salinum TaxID=1710538 RepID=UPI000F494244|nr:PAS domain S-box protein [Halosimplex salinum]